MSGIYIPCQNLPDVAGFEIAQRAAKMYWRLNMRLTARQTSHRPGNNRRLNLKAHCRRPWSRMREEGEVGRERGRAGDRLHAKSKWVVQTLRQP